MFTLHGIYSTGKTLLGIFTKDAQPHIASVVLVEGMDKKERKNLEARLREDILHPDDHFGEETASLSAYFSSRARGVLTVPVRNNQDALIVVKNVLGTDYQRFIFLCEDKQSYLSVCSELGMTRRDFLRFAELNAVLNQDEVSQRSTIGTAHRLYKSVKNKHVEIPFWDNPRIGLPGLVQDIFDSRKFLTLPYVWKDEGNDFTFGKGDHRLPYDKCLFECKIHPDDALNDEKRETSHFLLAYDNGGIYMAYIFEYDAQRKSHAFMGFGPSWKVDDAGRVASYDLFVMADDVLKYYQETKGWGLDVLLVQSFVALQRISPTLVAMNQPNVSLQHHIPKGGGIEKSNVPFFQCKEIKLSGLTGCGGNIFIGDAVSPRKKMALHEVRGHNKPSLDRWIYPYPRGDARYGVVHKSYK